jgi:hypothetical protein
MSTQNNTLKFKEVDVKLITCEAVKMGKDIVPLLKYGPDKKPLYIQGPWIKLKQYGIPPGETLSNGSKNDYYNKEDSRFSIRFPIDPKCCVQTDVENNPESTNSKDIEDFIKLLQAIDVHVKSDSTIMSISGIESDNKEKYIPIYRKPGKSKKNTDKVKYYSMKTKLDTDGTDSDKKIKTEFFLVDRETTQPILVNSNKYISMKELEETVKFNSEVKPIFQLVKIWTQSNDNWGVTLKLKKAQVRQSIYSERGNAEFLDSDSEHIETKPVTKSLSKSKSGAVSDSESDSDEEVTKVVPHKINKYSDEESDDEPVTKVVSKKQVEVDSESDDEPVTKVVSKKQVEVESDDEPIMNKPKHQVIVESDSDDDKPKKPVKKATKSKKSNA